MNCQGPELYPRLCRLIDNSSTIGVAEPDLTAPSIGSQSMICFFWYLSSSSALAYRHRAIREDQALILVPPELGEFPNVLGPM